jgi:hypothetical protein
MPKLNNLDPDNHSARIYKLITKLIGKLEADDGKVTVKELYMALASISRMQLYCQQFRLKEIKDEPAAGSAVRKYATAFSSYDTRRRKTATRPADDDADLDALIAEDDDERDTA